MRYYCGERSYRDTGIIVEASLCGGDSSVRQKSETSNPGTGNENGDERREGAGGRGGALITDRSRRSLASSNVLITIPPLPSPLLSAAPRIRLLRNVLIDRFDYSWRMAW